MSSSIRILWIDDDYVNHEDDAKNLESEISNLTVEIIHPVDLEKKLKSKIKKPDLFLVDFFLNQIPAPDGRIFPDRGLTVAGKLKERYPELPIYGVSHEEKRGMFDTDAQAAKSVFDKQLTFETVQNDGAKILYWDARDFRIIRIAEKENIDALLSTLKAPESIKDRFQLVLPDALRNGLGTKKEGNSIAFGRWILEKFLPTPGFLYDDLHAATHFGLTETAFKRISKEKRFKKIKYSGIFSKTSSDLWWVSELNNLVFSSPKAKKIDSDTTWEIAPSIFGISGVESSKCVVCNEPYPELVGINLDDENKLLPVHYRCSEPYPSKKRELFFDEIRGFKVNQ
jgi:hypothetical protein